MTGSYLNVSFEKDKRFGAARAVFPLDGELVHLLLALANAMTVTCALGLFGFGGRRMFVSARDSVPRARGRLHGDARGSHLPNEPA
jgi:hypothetical protein